MVCCGSLGGAFLCSYIVEVHAQRADEAAVIVVDRQIGPRPVGKQTRGHVQRLASTVGKTREQSSTSSPTLLSYTWAIERWKQTPPK